MRCTIRALNGRTAIAALLERDIPMRPTVVGGFTLELHPRRRNQSAALDTPLEGLLQRHETAGLGSELDRFKRLIEIGSRGPVAVPVVVVEEVPTRLVRFVMQVDTHFSLVGVRPVRLGRFETLDHPDRLHGRAVSRSVILVAGSGVPVAISNYSILRPLPRGRLVVIGLGPRTAVPRPDANIRLPVRESAHEGFEFRLAFDRTHPDDFACFIGEDAAFELVARGRRGVLPGFAQVLHEQRVALAGGGEALLLDGHVTSSADDVGHVEEVVALEAVEGDLGLFALVAVVHGDDGARVGVGGGLDGGFAVSADG